MSTLKQSVDQPGKVANPARGQLNRENDHFPIPVRACENLVSRDRFGRPVPRQSAHSPYCAQAESVAYSRDSSRFPRRRPFSPIAKRHLYGGGWVPMSQVVHGDLTTSNFMVRSGSERVVAIDFGLASSQPVPEDKV